MRATRRTRAAADMADHKILWGVGFVFTPGEVWGHGWSAANHGEAGAGQGLDRSPIRLLSPALYAGRGVLQFTR
jgi:hypothetical protein